jgi:hypothetical protein
MGNAYQCLNVSLKFDSLLTVRRISDVISHESNPKKQLVSCKWSVLTNRLTGGQFVETTQLQDVGNEE